MIRPPPTPPLFPHTTLSRSRWPRQRTFGDTTWIVSGYQSASFDDTDTTLEFAQQITDRAFSHAAVTGGRWTKVLSGLNSSFAAAAGQTRYARQAAVGLITYSISGYSAAFSEVTGLDYSVQEDEEQAAHFSLTGNWVKVTSGLSDQFDAVTDQTRWTRQRTFGDTTWIVSGYQSASFD